jgi:hypothetical protein
VWLRQVDVEGFESSVIKSANRLFTTKDVKNLVLEYNPGKAVLFTGTTEQYNPTTGMLMPRVVGMRDVGTQHCCLPAGVAEGSADDPRLSHLVTANPLMLMELLFRGYRIGLVGG